MATDLPPLEIVYATNWFNTPKFANDEDVGRDCPIPEGYSFNLTRHNARSWCTITSSTEDMDDAAALIFHAVDTKLQELPQRKDSQPWILESLEAPFSSPFRANPEAMKKFDYLASYNFNSTFLFSYFSPDIMDVVNRPLPKDFIKTKTKEAPILWIAKNCHATNGRQEYIKELMKYIDVHSYGECLNNQPFPEDKSRMELISEYKFYLAVENSNCEDYVTEKLADTIAMSAVPIVDGPSSYKGFVPTERSIIHMDAYPDPKDLADYINYLDRNDTAYLEYLAFRRDAINIAPKDRLEPTFIRRWSDTIAHKMRSSYCSVCRGVLPWWKAKLDGKRYVESDKNVFLTDNSCSPEGKWNYIINGPPYDPKWTPTPRDEFTRPNFYDSVQSSNDTKQIQQLVTTDKGEEVIIGNLAFVILFFAFISFLVKESKKAKKKAQLVDEAIV